MIGLVIGMYALSLVKIVKVHFDATRHYASQETLSETGAGEAREAGMSREHPGYSNYLAAQRAHCFSEYVEGAYVKELQRLQDRHKNVSSFKEAEDQVAREKDKKCWRKWGQASPTKSASEKATIDAFKE